MSGPRRSERREQAQAAVDEFALSLLGEGSTQTLLQKVVDLVARVVPDGSEVSMTLLHQGRASTAASSGARARDLDEVQYGQGHGPCLEAALGGQVVEVGDARTETRWPQCIPAFLRAGALSALAVPVPAVQLSAGLNVYASRVDAFTDEDRQTVARFAGFAALALANLTAVHEARELAQDLRVAMRSRAVIEQAKGILIERHKLTADEAFRLLAEASQHTNRKLRDLAEDLVLTGEL